MMIDVAGWGRDVGLIAELCVELACLGLKVRLIDTRPVIYVRCVGDDQLHRVEIRDGECFAWARGRHQHAAIDPKGAAVCIAAFVRRAANPGPEPRPYRGAVVCDLTSAAVGVVGVVDDPGALVERLVDRCEAAGLEAVALAPTRVRVNLRAGTSRTAEVITLKPDTDEVLCWWWSWNEPICPAADITRGVEMIAEIMSVVAP